MNPVCPYDTHTDIKIHTEIHTDINTHGYKYTRI